MTVRPLPTELLLNIKSIGGGFWRVWLC